MQKCMANLKNRLCDTCEDCAKPSLLLLCQNLFSRVSKSMTRKGVNTKKEKDDPIVSLYVDLLKNI